MKQLTFGEMTDMKLVYIKISDLQVNNIQDLNKHKSTRLLEESIARDGLLRPLNVNIENGKKILTDGYGRVLSLNRLGYTGLVPCIINQTHDNSAEIEQTKLAKATKRISLGNYFVGWAKSSNREEFLKTITSSTRRHIVEMINTFGEKEAAQLALDGTNPMLATDITRCANTLTHWGLYDKRFSRRSIGHWIIRNNGTTAISTLSQNGNRTQVERLAKCISEKRPYIMRRNNISRNNITV